MLSAVCDRNDYAQITWRKHSNSPFIQLRLRRLYGQLDPLANKEESFARFDSDLELPCNILEPYAPSGLHLEIQAKFMHSFRYFLSKRAYSRSSLTSTITPSTSHNEVLMERDSTQLLHASQPALELLSLQDLQDDRVGVEPAIMHDEVPGYGWS